MKILIVDDEPIIRVLLRQVILTSDGWEIFEAVSLNQAREVFEKEKPDVVITDIELGDTEGGGFQLIKEMKDRAVVIAMSSDPGSPEKPREKEVKEGGASYFFLKPFKSIFDLIEVIKAIKSSTQ